MAGRLRARAGSVPPRSGPARRLGSAQVASLTRAVVPWRTMLVGGLLAMLLAAALSRGPLDAGAPLGSSPALVAHSGLSSLPLAAQGPVSAALGADRHAFRVRASDGALLAGNTGQRLDARFTRAGASIATGTLKLGMRLQAIGSAGALRPLAAVAPGASGNRVTYAHPGVSEWYANGPLGIEQGFTVARAPAAGTAGPLTLSLALAGNGRVRPLAGGRGLAISRGSSSLRYDGLLASDASGRALHSRLKLRGRDLAIEVDTRGARYPLRIDPLIQQGLKLTGKEEEGPGNFGTSVAVSADGNTAIVGGPSDEIKGKEMLVGAAWVFTRSGSVWTQQGPKLRGEPPNGEAQFGISVAISADGNTALIGGITADIEKATLGAAWVFIRSGSTWSQQGPELTGSDETGGGRFGRSVALSPDGNRALIGGNFDNGQRGAIWAFARTGSKWEQQGSKITALGELGEAQFGVSLAISADGNTAIVGGPFDEGVKGSFKGAVWVYSRSGSSWSQQGPKLTGSAISDSSELGTSVALSADGNTALAGAPGDGASGTAVPFVRSGVSWSQQAPPLTPNDATSGAAFGSAVALSADGGTAVIGGVMDKDATVPTGAAWEFTRSGSTWTQQGPKLLGAGELPESEFGAAVALSSDGRTALIGGPVDNGDVGAVWAFVNPAVALPLPLLTLPETKIPTIAPGVRVTPVLSAVGQSHSRWRAGSARARLSATAKLKKPPVGTTFSFALNTPASVSLKFSRLTSGRRVKGKCVATSAKNRGKPKCKRMLSAGVLTLAGHKGTNKVAFQGVLANGKKLSPGSYTVALVAASGALHSSAKSLSFTIVR
jgi:hypothetical protein